MIFSERHPVELGSALYAETIRDQPPRLILGIDTEAEFDWDLPVSREKTDVYSIGHQHRAQDIFERYGLVPTYLIDYAVATNEAAVKTLRMFHDAGRCEIGAHLNPWINPPFDEPVDSLHSYAGNLSANLEYSKLAQLTTKIESNFGERPRVYRAGRYGIGANTAKILSKLGYQVDLSVVPRTSFAADGGPNFQHIDHKPFWFGQSRDLLEIPVSCGFSGWLADRGTPIFPFLSSPIGMRLHLPGLFARTGALERIRLTPEASTLVELRRLTESLFSKGCRIFSLTYHSPSLLPGNTPYVRDAGDLQGFLSEIEGYLRYFKFDLKGQFSTPISIYEELSKNR